MAEEVAAGEAAGVAAQVRVVAGVRVASGGGGPGKGDGTAG